MQDQIFPNQKRLFNVSLVYNSKCTETALEKCLKK